MSQSRASRSHQELSSARKKPQEVAPAEETWQNRIVSRRLNSMISQIFIFTLLVLLCVQENEAKSKSVKFPDDAQHQQHQQQQRHEVRLDCQPGEQRHFNYESATKVWGTSNQQVKLRGLLRLRCLEPATNGTLKYLAEVLSLSPSFGDDKNKQSTDKKTNPSYKRSADLLQRSDSLLSPIQLGVNRADVELARAEPVFEEVGEAISETATRVKRSVSGWFNKTWSSVKDFFVNIFNSSEKSTVSRDQAFREAGIDIANQCKSKSKNPHGLPIDDSVFDDFEPKYYIGASVDSLSGTAYEFDDRSDQFGLEDDEQDSTISFFDDPKSKTSRTKRATSNSGRAPRSSSKTTQLDVHEKLLRLPFVFIQLRTGKIVEVRFSNEETDLSIKNFKRHLCDLFATNLDKSKSQTNEVTPIGQHTTKYLIDSSTNSTAIKQSLLEAPTEFNQKSHEEQVNNKQLVKVLAMVAAATSESSSASSWTALDGNNTNSVEGREPSSGSNQGDTLSVLRSINSTTTIQLNSKTISPDIEQMEVRVKQVQHISDGRMTGSAGQLGMSLIQANNDGSTSKRIRFSRSLFGADKERPRQDNENLRTTADDQLADIADLLQVSTSFSVQLVPLSKLGNFEALEMLNKPEIVGSNADNLSPKSSDQVRVKRNSKKLDKSSERMAEDVNASHKEPKGGQVVADNTLMSQRSATGSQTGATTATTTRVKREPLVTRPSDLQELQSTMQEWRQTELKLKLSPSTLLPESSGQDGQVQRLEILRDQIQMRLNEEFVRNRLRRASGKRMKQQVSNVAALPSRPEQGSERQKVPQDGAKSVESKETNDLGLSLTQLILDNGITSKRKGSIYSTIEEVLDLEASLDEDSQESSISRLLRDTIRMDKLESHCKSAITSLEEIKAQSSRLELKMPFNVQLDNDNDSTSQGASEKLSNIVATLSNRNQKKLEQCKQVTQLLLRVNDRKAANLVIDMMDECNKRLVAASRDEELGYGPMSRYYRSLRQQFTELMSNLNRPSDSLMDKLLTRVHYLKSAAEVLASTKRKSQQTEAQQEFTYVSKTTGATRESSLNGQKYNKSLLKEEDDYNNNDGVGSLIMTITALGAKASISHSKRVEIVEKLLSLLKGSTCSLFNGPDLDILESMSNFQEPMDEIVGKIIHLARRCKSQDQYLVACVHGLQGQLEHALTQRFLAEQLRSMNVSCTVKSEIVLLLIGAILVEDLKLIQLGQQSLPPTRNEIPEVERRGVKKWPKVGMNEVDDVLLELVDESQADKRYTHDKKCLKQLVTYYMGKKEPLSNDINKPKSGTSTGRREPKRTTNTRFRRAVINDNSFWDDAQCKRWALPDSSDNSTLYNSPFNSLSVNEEVDDNSILVALANNRPISGNSSRGRVGAGRNLQLLERESDLSNKTGPFNAADTLATIRKRHKCSASKTYGPKNAQATLKAEVVNDLIGAQDENKFLARFRLSTNFLGNQIDVGRMYLWHQKRTTRAHVNILGKSLWDTSHSCQEKAPHHLLYMPLFDFNLWLVKVSVGLRLQSEMGFFSNCDQRQKGKATLIEKQARSSATEPSTSTPKTTPLPESTEASVAANDQLELFPTISLRASGEASAKFVVARAGMSLASQYGYQGSIRVSQQPESCMSIYSAHQPMNVTFSSWFQLWDNDCHYWGSRNKAEPQATKWKLAARKPTAWLEDECLAKSTGSLSAVAR